MKKALKFISVALLAGAMLFNFTACSDDDDDDGGSSSSSISLPASVGENPFNGKTLKISDYKEYKFAADTYTFTDEDSNVIVYSYTYDADKSLIYSAVKKVTYKEDGQEFSWSNASEYESLAKSWGESGAELEKNVAEEKAQFSTKITQEYVISGDSIELSDYFDGSLPSNVCFYNYSSDFDVEIESGELEIKIGSTKYKAYPTFKDGSFSGKVFKRGANREYSSAGTIKCTEVPEDLASYKDKEITLKQN